MDHAAAAADALNVMGETDMLELWEHDDGDQAVGVHQHENTGALFITTKDADGDMTCVQLTWREARALGVALVNGTAPWAARDRT